MEHVYSPADRPLVEVERDGRWFPGELRGYWDRDGRRLFNVSVTVRAAETYIETMDRARIRWPGDVTHLGGRQAADRGGQAT